LVLVQVEVATEALCQSTLASLQTPLRAVMFMFEAVPVRKP
jgi:hypothetical protein